MPLAPYVVLPWLGWPLVSQGLLGSVVVTLLALLGFGYVKGHFTTRRPWPSALQTLAVGGLAAAAAFAIAKLIG